MTIIDYKLRHISIEEMNDIKANACKEIGHVPSGSPVYYSYDNGIYEYYPEDDLKGTIIFDAYQHPFHRIQT
jgi:hypothetical protein